MKNIRKLLQILVLSVSLSITVSAMPPAQMKQMLNMTQSSWLSFRDFNAKQLLYFTHLEMYTCGIKEVRYSINNDKLDKIYPLQKCDPKAPMSMTKEKPYLTFELNRVKEVVLEVTFIDGTKSKILRKKP